MILCICNVVRDADIDTAIRAGVRSFKEFTQRTGCSGVCGTCSEDAEALFYARLKLFKAERRESIFGTVLACAA
jgi:bacterioferritin-associated ferredoxin